MPKTIAEVIAQVNAQPDSIIGLVRDGPIVYLVLNDVKDKDWKFDGIKLR